MSLVNFSVVLVGENFPVQSIKTSEFSFRHRPLKESLRLPVALQADNNLVDMQILQDRFELRVKEPDDLDKQVAGVSEMVETFLEYVGKRTVTAVGQNGQWTLPLEDEARVGLANHFANVANLAAVVGGDPDGVDIAFGFKLGSETKARASLNTSPEGGVLLDLNFHFDVTRPADIANAMTELPNSLAHMKRIGEALDHVGTSVKS